ncbi:hypothetical protein DPEC_G00097370 [Dallia pectoralis]|uniref:Uncharacterized protein n=1 Tax=Dallia pectoralis TaxID=75939 RepID=A0ACC2GVS5_DALPE|nr:hypothetical protein DPEC_G00097370 [Dallia pectoralis]
MPLITCENGGIAESDGLSCICPSAFSGKTCRTIKDNIKPAFNRTVFVTMKTAEEYLPQYSDKTSTEYKDKVKNITQQMDTYYKIKKIEHFSGVENVTLSNGSAVTRSLAQNTMELLDRNFKAKMANLEVEYDIVLAILNEQGADKIYEEVFQKIETAVTEVGLCEPGTDGCPSFKVTETNLTVTEVDDKGLCKNIIDSNVLGYFEPINKDGERICVTACDPRHKERRNCNSGTCEVNMVAGASCYCQHTQSTWNLGADCNYQINKIGFYAGIILTAGFLLVIVGVLTAFLLANKKRTKRNKDTKGKMVNQWLEDDFEWPPPNGKFANTPQLGSYDNPAYNRGALNYYQQPSVSLPSFNPDPYSNNPTQYYPQIQMNNMSRNQPTRINRPQIRTSYEM